MASRAPLLLCLAVLAASCRRDSTPKADLYADTVAMVRESDPEMRAAISRAKARLPAFWKEFEAASARDVFSVKVPVTDAGSTEYFWLVHVARADGRVSGTIDNRPNLVSTVVQGQRLEVNESEIVDWLYWRDEKMYGNFTARALLKTLPREQAEALKAVFAEP